ncbi:MAG: FAD-dependent oxidoreductase [Flavobacteriales bacterium]|nr:FAD-dependent oxidoreductase [Flavobacteriales bacterium]
MKRRTFIEKSILTYLGLVLSPTLLVSCRKETLFPDSNFSGKVIIIGAGAAGLYAGYILKSRGIDFKIIEASNRTGGRLGKKSDFADYPIDLGAQWLHGRNSILGDLSKSTGTKITKDNSDLVYWFNNQITSSISEDVDSIVSSNSNLPDISFLEYAQQQGLGNEYKYLVEQIAGDSGADSSDISIKWNAVEEEGWNSGDTDFKFEESFFDLIDKNITEEIKGSIILNTPITKITYSGENVLLNDKFGNSYQGDKVMLTVPITILQDEDIEFEPALPQSKIDAFNKIGMGAGMKVFLKFSSKFYDENIAGGEICAAYVDEVVGKNGSDNVLLAFVMGQQAEHLTSLGSDLAITNALLTELDAMYSGQATVSFINSHVENWTTNPYIKGAYSYSKVGIGNARSIAAKSVNNKLFFAGEAMNLNGHHQTVHGAIETGYREVINILKS